MAEDFYEGMAEQTAERLKKAQAYVEMAIKNGDAAYIEKPHEVKIIIRLNKKEK